MKTLNKKDKLKNDSNVLMKSVRGSTSKGKDKARSRRFFLQRGDSTSSGRGFVSDSEDDGSEEDVSATGHEEGVFLDESLSTTPVQSQSTLPSVSSPCRINAAMSLSRAPPRRSVSLSQTPTSTSTLPHSTSTQSMNQEDTGGMGTGGDKQPLQPIPPTSPAPSPTKRPPFVRTFSGTVVDETPPSSCPENTTSYSPPPQPNNNNANNSPPVIVSPPTSPRSKPAFVRQMSGGNRNRSSNNNNTITSTEDSRLSSSGTSTSVSPPPFGVGACGGELERGGGAGGSGDVEEDTSSSFSYLSMDNLNFHSSNASLATTSSVTSFNKEYAEDCSNDGSNYSESGSESSQSETSVDGKDYVSPELRARVEEAMQNLNILLIEDSNFQRKLMTLRLLNMMNVDPSELAERWPVMSASNGEEALTMIDNVQARMGKSYDILIVDEVLDGSGGILMGHEIIEHLRTRPDMARTLMIGCTANMHQFGDKILEAGANAVWAKPMQDPMIVRECIQKLLLDMMMEEEKEGGRAGSADNDDSSSSSSSSGISDGNRKPKKQTLSMVVSKAGEAASNNNKNTSAT